MRIKAKNIIAKAKAKNHRNISDIISLTIFLAFILSPPLFYF
jgi:hypothetical protein